jgi:phosphohistidine phosphatase
VKRLLLLRHAKSAPGDARASDAQRALNERGRADAPRMGGVMHRSRYVPDLVLCSSAKRTVETWQRLAPELESAPEPSFLDSLYLAAFKSILKIVRSASDSATVALVIGHNPGLEECAVALARPAVTPEEHERRTALETKFPTCALAVLDFDVAHWRDIAPGGGALTDFVRPKDLRDA